MSQTATRDRAHGRALQGSARSVKVAARACLAERCPYCREALDAWREVCRVCGTPHHPDCLAELARCTVLGCPGPRARVRQRAPAGAGAIRPQSPWSWGRAARWLAASGATLVLVAAVLPSFFGHRCRGSNGPAAIGSLRTIANAQTLYREGDKDGDGTPNFAPNLQALTNTGPLHDDDLIDEVLGTGTKRGYVFTLRAEGLVWTANADPAIPRVTGERYFGGNMAGQIFFSTEGPVRFNPDGSSPDTQLGR